MKKNLILTSLAVLALTGCNTESKVVSTEISAEANADVIDSEESAAEKKKFKIQIDELMSELKNKEKEVGYLTPEEYVTLKGKSNLIAMSFKSDGIIEYNDNEHIVEMLNKVLGDINEASEITVLKAADEVNSSNNMYISVFQEKIHLLMNFIDLKGERNRIDEFLIVYGDSESANEILEKTQWYKEEIEKFEYESILTLEKEVIKYQDVFSEKELLHLNSLLRYLKNSTTLQIDIFKEIGSESSEVVSLLTDKINRADEEYRKAETELDLLESEMGIKY